MNRISDTQVEAACEVLRKAIHAAENSNHNGEVFVVAAANALAMKDALEFWAGQKTITEVLTAGPDPDWIERSVEERIQIMGERKRKHDAAIIAARQALALANGERVA